MIPIFFIDLFMVMTKNKSQSMNKKRIGWKKLM